MHICFNEKQILKNQAYYLFTKILNNIKLFLYSFIRLINLKKKKKMIFQKKIFVV